MARLIAELPGIFKRLAEAREIAGPLVDLLPKHDVSPIQAPQVQIRPCMDGAPLPRASYFWVICLVITAAALVSAVVYGWPPFGIGSP